MIADAVVQDIEDGNLNTQVVNEITSLYGQPIVEGVEGVEQKAILEKVNDAIERRRLDFLKVDNTPNQFAELDSRIEEISKIENPSKEQSDELVSLRRQREGIRKLNERFDNFIELKKRGGIPELRVDKDGGVVVENVPAKEQLEVHAREFFDSLGVNLRIESDSEFKKVAVKNGASVNGVGFVDSQGNVHINENHLSEEALMHEFGHIWGAWARRNDPAIYAEMIEYVSKSPEAISHLKKYPELKLRGAIESEMVAYAFGKYTTMSNKNRTLYRRMKDFFRRIGGKTGRKKGWELKRLADFTKKAVHDFYKQNPYLPKAFVENDPVHLSLAKDMQDALNSARMPFVIKEVFGKSKWDNWADSLVYLVNDKKHRLRILVENLTGRAVEVNRNKKLGKVLPDEKNPYAASITAADKVNNIFSKLTDDFVEFFGDVNKSGSKLQDVVMAAYAMHAPERNAQIKSKSPNKLRGSGLSDFEAHTILKGGLIEVTENPAMQRYAYSLDSDLAKVFRKGNKIYVRWKGCDENTIKLAEKFSKMTSDKRLDYLVQSGAITKTKADKLRKTYKHYVPLATEEKGDIVVINPVESKGAGIVDEVAYASGVFEMVNPLDIKNNMIESVYRSAYNSVYNPVAQKMSKIMDEHDGGKFYGEKRAVSPQAVTGMSGVGRNDFSFYSGGQKYAYEIKNGYFGDVIKSMLGIDDVRNNAISIMNQIGADRWWAGTNNFLRQMQTSYNPDFWMPNFIRDSQTAFISMATKVGVKSATNVFKNAPRSMKALIKSTTGRTGGDKFDTYLQEMIEEGFTTPHTTLDLQSIDISDIENAKTPSEMLRAFKKLRTVVEDINMVAETTFRLSTYATMRDAGYSKLQAGLAAKENTVNFSKRGLITQQLGRVYLYLQPKMHSTHMLMRMASGKHGRRMLSATFAAGFANALLNGLMDPEEYRKQLTYNRDGKFFIPYTEVGIPVSYVFKPTYGMGRMLGDKILEDVYKLDIRAADEPSKAETLLDYFAEAFTPMFSDMPESGEDVVVTIAPSAIRSFVASAVNWDDFRDRHISSVDLPWSRERFAHEKGTARTDFFYKFVAEKLNDIVGLDVDPNKAQYITESMLPFIQKIKNADEAAVLIMDGEYDEAAKISPILRSFTTRMTNLTRHSIMFEEAWKKSKVEVFDPDEIGRVSIAAVGLAYEIINNDEYTGGEKKEKIKNLRDKTRGIYEAQLKNDEFGGESREILRKTGMFLYKLWDNGGNIEAAYKVFDENVPPEDVVKEIRRVNNKKTKINYGEKDE